MKKVLRCMAVAMAILMLGSFSAAAAGTTSTNKTTTTATTSKNQPGNVATLKVSKTTDTTVTLTWSKATKATGYYVYRVSGSSIKKVGTTTKTKCVIKKLSASKSYKFKVIAYRKVGKKIYKSASYSNVVTAKTTAVTPAKPTNVVLRQYGNNTLRLTWDKASKATGYEVYRVLDDGTYKLLSTVRKKHEAVYKNLSAIEYTLVVRSYRTSGGKTTYSDYSAKVSATPKTLSEEAQKITDLTFNAKTKKKTTAYDYTTKETITLAKNTRIYTTTKRASSNFTAYLANGHKIKIAASAVKVTGLNIDRQTDFSKSAKEEYINSKNLSSNTKYLIWIDQGRARVNVFKGSKNNWKLARTFRVIIGRLSNTSPRGVFRIRYKWSNGYFGKPQLQWTNSVQGKGNTFHCRVDGTKMSSAASAGCIRCYDSDLYYLWNNCAVGTTVYSN